MRAVVAAWVTLALWSLPSAALGSLWPSEVDRVTRGLHSRDVGERRQAAAQLGEIPAAAARKLVPDALKDPDADVRLRGLELALTLEGGAAQQRDLADLVLPWLAESDVRLRMAAADALRLRPSVRAVASLGRALGDTDPAVRRAAARALGACDSPDAVLPLLGHLDDSLPEVREEIALALASLGDPRAVLPLIGKIEDSRPSVRLAVARALGELADARSVGALVLSLRDSDDEVKVAALEALARVGDISAAPSVVALLEGSPSSDVRAAALLALGRLGTPEGNALLIAELGRDDAEHERGPVLRALQGLGEASLPLLEHCLDDSGEKKRSEGCVLALGATQNAASAPRIVAAVERGAVSVEVGLDALGRIGEPSVLPAVLEHLRDPDPRIRGIARRAAAKLLDPLKPDGRAVDPIGRALTAPKLAPDERRELAMLLGRTGSARAAGALIPLAIAKDDPSLRETALEALGAIGPAGQDQVLLAALDDDHDSVRRAAALALRKVASAEILPQLMTRLERSAEQDRGAVTLGLAGSLSRVKSKGSVESVVRLLEHSHGPERDALIEALAGAPVPEALQALDAMVRQSAEAADRAKVAEGLVGRSDAIPLLRRLLADQDAGVRANAAWSLGVTGTQAEVSVLVARTRDPDQGVVANAAISLGRLRATSPESGQALCAVLNSALGYARANALTALRLLDRRCDRALERRLLGEDEVEATREAAARLVGSVHPDAGDRRALRRCLREETSNRVARFCEQTATPVAAATQPVSVFVVPSGADEPLPRAPFALALADGSIRLGTCDRRGAVFEAKAPVGELELLVPAPLAH